MRIVMMGTGTFAEPTFEALLSAKENVVGLVTQPDREAGRKGGSTRQTGKGMAAIAAGAGVPVAQPEKVNTPDGVAAVKAFEPDLLVIAAYGQLLSPEVLAIPKHGSINVHASLLPKYRGASPVAHAILNGETQTGVTIIRVSPSLDAGEMLAREALAIGHDETAGELEGRLAPIGATLAVSVVAKLKAGPVPGERQDPAQVTLAPKLKKEQGLIDWGKPATKIANHIRAMQPWPTPYTFLHRPGKEPMRVIINKVRKFGMLSGIMPNRGWVGALSEMEGGRLLVQVFDGTSVVEVVELQPAGKNRMATVEFLRGHPIEDGCRFGPEKLA